MPPPPIIMPRGSFDWVDSVVDSPVASFLAVEEALMPSSEAVILMSPPEMVISAASRPSEDLVMSMVPLEMTRA